MYWRNLNHPDFEKISRNTPVIVPIAATEQHGKHLPVAADSLINQHFLTGLENKISQEVLILPIIEVGYSEHHMDMTGSLSVSHETLIHYLEDIITSVIRHNFHNIILFNSHGGNQGVAQIVTEKIGMKYKKVNLVNLTWWKLIIDDLKQIIDGDEMKTGHACEVETSILLDYNPSIVRKNTMEAGDMMDFPNWSKGNLVNAPNASLARTMREMTGNGVFGNPLTASVDKGKKIHTAMVDALTQLVRELKLLKR